MYYTTFHFLPTQHSTARLLTDICLASAVVLLLIPGFVQISHGETLLSTPIAPVAVVGEQRVFTHLVVAGNMPVIPVKVPSKIVQRVAVAVVPVAPAVVAVVPAEIPAVPAPTTARLIIPKIGVNAVIRDMGETPDGAMAVPGNHFDTGWYSPGTRPGKTGSAVIGGHNRWEDRDAVFIHLDRLTPGDVVTVVDVNGVSTSFVVREMRTFEATDLNSGIFESASGIHLNLITCSGIWDPITRSYPSRLVVFTDLVAASP